MLAPIIAHRPYYRSDRSETARQLLELDNPAPAGVEDDSGQSAISWMITKMPPVVSMSSSITRVCPSPLPYLIYLCMCV